MMSDRTAENSAALAGLREVLASLLDTEAGCPWDREQTVESLCPYALEEMYELTDAVRGGTAAEQCEELGDVLFVLLFMAFLWEKQGLFTLAAALEQSRAKMIGRHPHVFGKTSFADREEQLSAWEKIKQAEKAGKKAGSGIFASLPVSLPALIKAYRINSKSARHQFTWDTDEDAEMQVEAEWLEFIDAARAGDAEAQEHELGDLLFSIVELGRRKGLKADVALDKANARFLRRFAAMERLAAGRGLDFSALSQAEKDALWTEVKEGELQGGTGEGAEA